MFVQGGLKLECGLTLVTLKRALVSVTTHVYDKRVLCHKPCTAGIARVSLDPLVSRIHVNFEAVVADKSSMALLTLVLFAKVFLHVVFQLNLTMELLTTHLTNLLLFFVKHHVPLEVFADFEC